MQFYNVPRMLTMLTISPGDPPRLWVKASEREP